MNVRNIIFAALPAAAMAAGLAALTAPGVAHAENYSEKAEFGTMHVTKSPSCGCCTAWVALAREEGYEVEITDTRDYVGPKREAGVPDKLWACHTATIDGYVIEGHVPFAAIEKLLSERPEITGIAVPGMPAGSPGMGNDPTARYDVVPFGGSASAGEVFYRAGS